MSPLARGRKHAVLRIGPQRRRKGQMVQAEHLCVVYPTHDVPVHHAPAERRRVAPRHWVGGELASTSMSRGEPSRARASFAKGCRGRRAVRRGRGGRTSPRSSWSHRHSTAPQRTASTTPSPRRECSSSSRARRRGRAADGRLSSSSRRSRWRTRGGTRNAIAGPTRARPTGSAASTAHCPRPTARR